MNNLLPTFCQPKRHSLNGIKMSRPAYHTKRMKCKSVYYLIVVLVSYCHRYEYKMAREYNWNVKNKASKGYEVCSC